MSEEVYCALCGVPFGVDTDLYRTGSVTDDDVAWTPVLPVSMSCTTLGRNGYLIPRQVRRMKYEKPCDWYLSGIGRNGSFFGWESLVPTEPDYDAREHVACYSWIIFIHG